MRDLYRCLDEYIPELLQAIAVAWQIALPKGESRETVSRLADGMLAPGALEGVLQNLSAEAREILVEVVREGGAVPGHRLSLQYGALRRLGPARMLREQPWNQPTNAVEALFYKGLLYRSYGTIGDYYGETLLVPQQLFAKLSALTSGAPELSIQPVDTPPRLRSDGRALSEDLLVALVHLRQSPVSTAERDAPRVERALGEIVPPGRWSGENHPERMALLRRILGRLRLVHDSRGLLRPNLRAREWLQLPDTRRQKSVYLAWRDDPRLSELRLLPSLGLQKAGRQENPVGTRRALTEILAQCPRGVWLSLASFVSVLKRLRPDYLRPDGDYASWNLRDVQTGAYLGGAESWEQVEGALARQVVTLSLRWVGVVDVGYDEKDQPTCFRVTKQGEDLLANHVTADTEQPDASEKPMASISDDLTVTISLEDTLYERYQLERLAAWQSQDNVATYRVTLESLWNSQNAGIRMEQIVRFLERISQDQVPAAALRALQAWGGKFGRVVMRQTLLLQTADERTMEQLKARPEVRALLGMGLSPTTCLVPAENIQALTAQLKAMGIWPLLRS
jgi:hypothetical protein